MSLFTSDLERRLWIWTVVVLVVIYSTLGLAGRVVQTLRELNLLRISFAAFLLLAGAVIVVHWIKRRPGRNETWVAIGVTAVFLWAMARTQHPEERTHLIEYSLVALLIHEALKERRRNGRRVPAPAALALGATVLLGFIDECIQALLPNRVYDIRDVGFNALAALMAIAASLALSRARRRDSAETLSQ
jgi:hypothetical protein